MDCELLAFLADEEVDDVIAKRPIPKSEKVHQESY